MGQEASWSYMDGSSIASMGVNDHVPGAPGPGVSNYSSLEMNGCLYVSI